MNLGSDIKMALWQHSLGDVVTAVAAAGLRLDFLHEQDHLLEQWFPILEKENQNKVVYKFPKGKEYLPLAFSLKGTKL